MPHRGPWTLHALRKGKEKPEAERDKLRKSVFEVEDAKTFRQFMAEKEGLEALIRESENYNAKLERNFKERERCNKAAKKQGG